MRANSFCGFTTSRSLDIGRRIPTKPGELTTTELSQVCPIRRFSYSIPEIPLNSNSLVWNVPAGAIIDSGQGTTKIYVTYTTASTVSDFVIVNAINGCGPSSTRKLAINLPVCNPAIVRINPAIQNEFPGENKTKQPDLSGEIDVKVMPNPTQSYFNLQFTGMDKLTPVQLRITDMKGKIMEIRRAIPGQMISIGAAYMKGIYIAEFIQGKERKTVKLFKL